MPFAKIGLVAVTILALGSTGTAGLGVLVNSISAVSIIVLPFTSALTVTVSYMVLVAVAM